MTTRIDITSEQSRKYHYSDGSTFTVPSPQELYVIQDDRGATHRIVSEDGRTYRPERGWVGISWVVKDGCPPFIA